MYSYLMELMYTDIIKFIERLNRCGISMSEATRTAYDIQKNYGWDALEEYVESIEEDTYVGRIQS